MDCGPIEYFSHWAGFELWFYTRWEDLDIGLARPIRYKDILRMVWAFALSSGGTSPKHVWSDPVKLFAPKNLVDIAQSNLGKRKFIHG